MKGFLKSLVSYYHAMPSLARLAVSIAKHSRPGSAIRPASQKLQKCVILGNGPSLKTDMDRIQAEAGLSDMFAVNHFADHASFEALKPKYYIFLDPYFWSPQASLEYTEKRAKTYHNLLNKTDWPLTIFIPSYADREIFKQLDANPEINVRVYNAAGAKDIPHRLFATLIDTGLCAPYGINVVHHAIYAAMRMGYRSIEVYGIDTSVMLSYEVDQTTNKLHVAHKHFYGVTRTVPDEAGLAKRPLNLAQALEKELEIFRGYEFLAFYAKSKKVRLINRAAFSLVDSLPRC